MKNKTYKGLKKYSPEYDSVMNKHLEIIEDVYNYDAPKDEKNYVEDTCMTVKYGSYPKYSIKLPNEMTGLRLVDYMDGDQAAYDNTDYLNMLEELDLYHDDSIADYPRHGDTLRIFYHDLEKAQAALFFLKKLCNLEKSRNKLVKGGVA